MRCGVCHAPLRVRGYRSVATSRGRRRVPLYHPCPSLDDPERHPARRRDAPTRETAGPADPGVDAVPFPRGARLRFAGHGPLASRVPAGTEVVVRDVLGSRSLVDHGGRAYAIWPEHAAHWQVVEPAEDSSRPDL